MLSGSLLDSRLVEAGPSDGFYGSNVQNGARDEYSAKVCGVPLAKQWRGDEVGDRGGSVVLYLPILFPVVTQTMSPAA